MKAFNYIGILVTCFVIFFASCKEDDTTVSTFTSFEKFTTTFPSAVTVTEPEGADETHTVTITFNENQIMDLNLEVSVVGSSTATEDVDFALAAHEVSLTALRRQAGIDVIVHGDADPEGDETIVLHVSGLDPYGVPLPAEAHVITIRNREYPTDIFAGWEGDYIDSAGTQSLCDNIDIDLFILDDQGNFAGGFGGATAACPEHMVPGSLADGTYSIVVNLYDNGAAGSPGLVESPIPITVLMAKGGVLLPENSTLFYSTGDFNQVPVWTTFTPSDPDGLANVTVGTLRVAAGKVTLVNPAGVDVGEL